MGHNPVRGKGDYGTTRDVGAMFGKDPRPPQSRIRLYDTTT